MAERARLHYRIGDRRRDGGEGLGDARVVGRAPLPLEPARIVPGHSSAPAHPPKVSEPSDRASGLGIEPPCRAEPDRRQR
jgi:hypothetical protein